MAGHTQGTSTAKATTDLRGAVSRATASLNALAEGWKTSNARHAKCTLTHVQIQRETVHTFKSVSESEVTSYEDNIEQCLDLLERLEKAEGLALKLQGLRATVDRIAHQLDQRTPSP